MSTALPAPSAFLSAVPVTACKALLPRLRLPHLHPPHRPHRGPCAVANTRRASAPPVPSGKTPSSSVGSGGEDEGTGALESVDGTLDRYLDLRTLKKMRWSGVRVAGRVVDGCNFGPFESSAAVAAVGDDVIFGEGTLELKSGQRDVVRSLLGRRSVFYCSSQEDREGIVLDLGGRAGEWGQTVVYCAPTLREAEAMYRVAVAKGSGGSKGVALEVGHETIGKERAGLVITVPRVLRRAVVDMGAFWWMRVVDCVVLNDVLMGDVPEWEEIILGLPSRVLLCVCASDLDDFEQDEIPLWLETVQNSTVPIMPRGMMHFQDRVDRPVHAPLVRAFIFNALVHEYPIQVSLPLVIEELQKDIATAPRKRLGRGKRKRRKGSRFGGQDRDLDASSMNMDDIVAAGNVEYANALLPGLQVLPAEDLSTLLFMDALHAMYADVAALVLADARETEEKSTGGSVKAKKRTGSRKKTSATLFSEAVRRRKRTAAHLLPALVFVHGRAETEAAAAAVRSVLETASVKIVCDPGAVDTLGKALDSFVSEHGENLMDIDIEFVESLRSGIGFVHRGLLPALRSMAEELFRDGLVPVLLVDSHMGPKEVAHLPRARSVLVQSSCLGEQSDALCGLLKGSLLGSLAGRTGVDEVGNVLALWFDEDVADEEASGDLAASLFAEELVQEQARFGVGNEMLQAGAAGSISYRNSRAFREGLLDRQHPSALLSTAASGNGRHTGRRSGAFLTTYPGLLSTLRRHGEEGYKTVVNYALDSYRGWLVGAGLRATREKVEVEKRAVDEHLVNVKWDELATHDRIASKLDTQRILYGAMVSRQPQVLADRVLESLKSAEPGTVIGLLSSQNRLLGTGNSDDKESKLPAQPLKKGMAGKEPGTNDGGGGSPDQNDIVPAILVAVLENASDMSQKAVVEGDILIVCIMVDGRWTLAPVCDVCSISEGDALVPNVDLIPIPHLAAFDLEPSTQWAKCTPVSDGEIARINDASKALISSLMTGGSVSSALEPLMLDEIVKQEERLKAAQKAYDKSPWSGREAEASNLRRLRRRALELGDDANALRKSEARLDGSLQEVQGNLDARLRAELAVLEDCNAISVSGKGSLEMTPIGALASVLPGPHPLFAAACLVLVSGLDELSPAQLAAFVLIMVARRKKKAPTLQDNPQGTNETSFDSRSRSSENASSQGSSNDPLGPRRANSGDLVVDELQLEYESLTRVLPDGMINEMESIRSALHIVQERHFESGELLKVNKPSIAPSKIELQSADALFRFLDGECSWTEMLTSQELQGGELVRDFRLCAEALRVMLGTNAGLGVITDVQPGARKALDALSVWPICGTVSEDCLGKAGVSAGINISRKVSASYKAWWKRSADEIATAVKEAEAFVELKDAEVVESESMS